MSHVLYVPTINNRKSFKNHKKAFRVGSKDETNISFDALLIKDKSVSIHQRNLQILSTEYKVRNDLGPTIVKDNFQFVQKPYNLRNEPVL